MSKRFISQIVKRLKCSKAKRMEIRKQLTSEIAAAMENGEKEEEIWERMGTPFEIAEEFNNGFPDSERKKHKKEKWIKGLSIAAVILLVLVAVGYWALPKATLVEDGDTFQEANVQEQAKDIVLLLDAGDYEALKQRASEQMQSVLTADYMEQAKRNFSTDWGEFQSFGKIYVSEVNQMGKRFAVAQVNASYKNIGITYTISFDEDMKLAGLYMK